MTAFTTDNISLLQATPLNWPGTWRITFVSTNAPCMFYQLYLNGRLSDVTDAAAQRHFTLRAGTGPMQVVVAAVAADERFTDFGRLLPQSLQNPAWVHKPYVSRRPCPAGTFVALLGDHAAGRIDPMPTAKREIWPQWLPRWAFGEDEFGAPSGFGVGGSRGPGWGNYEFGGGLFGVGGGFVDLSATVNETGTHTFVLRTIDPDGRHSDAAPYQVNMSLPS